MAFKVGAIVSKLTLDKSGWTQAVKSVEKDQERMQRMTDKTAAKFKKVGMVMTVAGGAIVAGMASMVNKASEAEETFAKFGTIFKDVMETAEQKARDLADSYGLSTLASKDMLAATGDLLTGLGMMPEVALDLSEKTQQLAVDLASFTNFSGGAKGASEALTKAMLGERESIKSLGIVITEEMVKEELLAQGKDKLTGLAQKEAAAEATLTIAYRQSQNAIGDYERTSGSLANQKRLLKSRIEDLSVSLGTTLIPIVTSMITKITDVVKKISDWVKENPKLAETIVKITAGVGALMLALGPFVMIIPKIVTGIGDMRKSLKLAIVRMKAFKLATIAAAGPIVLLTSALAALAVGYMKVKKAKDALIEASKREADVTDRVFAKLKKAADAAGVTEREFVKLTNQYKLNAGAMMKAVREGKHGVEWQEKLRDVAKESAEEYKKQKEATDNLGASMADLTGRFQGYLDELKETKEETKTWVDYLKSIGVQTIQQKEDRIKELTGYLEDLKIAYENGKLSLEDYIKSTNKATKEIEGLSETIIDTTPLAARSFGLAFGKMTAKTSDFAIKAKTKVIEVKNKWVEMSERIRDAWTMELGAMLSGSKSFKDALASIWDTMKNQFFDVIAQMISKWTFDFIGNLVGSAKKGFGTVVDSVKNLGKGITDTIKGFSAGGIAQGVISGAVSGLVSGLMGGFPKHSQEHMRLIHENSTNILATLRTDFRDRQYNWFLDRYDRMLEALYGVIPRKFDHIAKILGVIKDNTAPIKNMISAARGAVVDEPTLAALHGSPANPEIVTPVSGLIESLKGIGGGSATLSQNVNVNIMVKDHLDPYSAQRIVREQIVPSMLKAIEVNSRNKTRMREILGVQI